MARKRSSSGRSRVINPVNRIYIQTEKLNRKLRSLEKAGNYGTYKSKELIRFASNISNINIKRSRGSKRHRVEVSNLRGAGFGRLILINKKFGQINRSKGFSNVGIKNIRKKTLKTLKKTLKGIKGSKITRRDVDMFYEIIKYKTDEIINKIGPSEFFALVEDARENNATSEQWIEMINNYVAINNQSMRRACEYLYNKFVVE